MPKFYLHYKNKPYRRQGLARHSETQESMVVYECMYPNDSGKLWVRPQDNFESQVTVEGNSVARFREVPFQLESFSKVDDRCWSLIEPLIKGIFESAHRGKTVERLEASADVRIDVAFFENEAVGFKIGHASKQPEVFESWLGGVRADRRGLGVATELMRAQHQFARQQGYKKCRTKTLNFWKEMLMLDLQQGFQIVGTEPSARGLKIILEKNLIAQ